MSEAFRRAAFVVTPHAGGTFSVYRSLRAALALHGIDLEWVGPCDHPESVQNDPGLAGIFSHGHLIDSRGQTQQQTAAALLQKLTGQAYSLVFVNVLTSPAEMAVAAYLPKDVKRVMIVHNITLGTYDAARAVAPFVDAAVGVCPRIRSHLVNTLRIPPKRAYCVPNALDIAAFPPVSPKESGGETRVLSLSRIIDIDKGVFWLPEVMTKLGRKEGSYRLTVAGDGPDLEALKKRSIPLGDRISFLGKVPTADVPRLMADHDVFLMMSRFEGFGYTLIEAMAGGCVPAASRILGVTDFVVQEEKTGFLFPVGRVGEAADAIQRLASDSATRKAFVRAGRTDVEARFSIAAMARGYGDVLQYLQTTPDRPNKCLAATNLELLTVQGGWRRLVPESLKNVARNWVYRQG